MKEEFKLFVKKNPTLLNYVKTNEMTWQKFYEMYELYGEEDKVWNDYIKREEVKKSIKESSPTSLNDVVKWFKNVDLDSIQESIGNVQRVLGVVQDFSKKDKVTKDTNSYKPRPLYRHFED